MKVFEYNIYDNIRIIKFRKKQFLILNLNFINLLDFIDVSYTLYLKSY